MSNLLIHVEDPGAANWIVPLLPVLAARGLDHTLVCEAAIEDYLAARGVSSAVLPEGEGAEAIIARISPGMLLTGTSENLESRSLALIDAARVRGLPTAAFVDQGANAEHRFRGRGGNPLAHAPDRLFVPDEDARAAFARLGFARERIVVTGNPHLDRVRAAARVLAHEGRGTVRARVLPDAPADRPVVVFLAEIGYVVNPEAAEWERTLSFAGRMGTAPRCARILEEVIDALGEMTPRPWLVLRLHPKNRREDFAEWLGEVDAVSEGGDPLALLWAADLVIGMSSVALEEAWAMGRPVLSVLPHPVERTWLAALAAGHIRTVETRDDLRAALHAPKTWVEPCGMLHGVGRSASEIFADALGAYV